MAFVNCRGRICAGAHHDSPDVAMEMKRRAKLGYGFNVSVEVYVRTFVLAVKFA